MQREHFMKEARLAGLLSSDQATLKTHSVFKVNNY
jgi:hypothetical protein